MVDPDWVCMLGGPSLSLVGCGHRLILPILVWFGLTSSRPTMETCSGHRPFRLVAKLRSARYGLLILGNAE